MERTNPLPVLPDRKNKSCPEQSMKLEFLVIGLVDIDSKSLVY